MKTNQVELADIVVVSEVLSQVEVVHELKDQSERVLSSGINPDEWYHMSVGEASAYQHFVVKPLSIGSR